MNLPLFDISIAYKELLKELGKVDTATKQAVLKQIMAGTVYNNLANFSYAKDITVPVKLERYNKALAYLTGQTTDVTPFAVKEEPKTETESLVSVIEKQKNKIISLEKEYSEKALSLEKEYENKFISLIKDFNEKQSQKRVEEIIIHNAGAKTVLNNKVYHKQFPQLLKSITARNAQGWTEFHLVVSDPGTGKSEIAAQLSEALSLRLCMFAAKEDMTTGQLLGYRNLVNGDFVKGLIYDAYKEGGLCVIDEAFLSSSALLAAINNIDNSRYMFPNGEMVERHKDFYLLLIDNTLGTGATRGFTRQKADAASLNRLTVFKLDYDNQLEHELFQDTEWIDYVQKVREFCNRSMLNVFVTPRASRKGEALFQNGFDEDYVCDSVLFPFMTAEQKKSVLANIGPFRRQKQQHPKQVVKPKGITPEAFQQKEESKKSEEEKEEDSQGHKDTLESTSSKSASDEKSDNIHKGGSGNNKTVCEQNVQNIEEFKPIEQTSQVKEFNKEKTYRVRIDGKLVTCKAESYSEAQSAFCRAVTGTNQQIDWTTFETI